MYFKNLSAWKISFKKFTFGYEILNFFKSFKSVDHIIYYLVKKKLIKNLEVRT